MVQESLQYLSRRALNFPQEFWLPPGGVGVSADKRSQLCQRKGNLKAPYAVCTKGGGPFSVEPPFMGGEFGKSKSVAAA